MNEESDLTANIPSVRGNVLVDESDRQKEYIPNRIEILRNYHVNIRFLSIGCIIEVGCKSIPFQTIAEGMKALNDYINTPYPVTKIWEERFKKEELGQL